MKFDIKNVLSLFKTQKEETINKSDMLNILSDELEMTDVFDYGLENGAYSAIFYKLVFCSGNKQIESFYAPAISNYVNNPYVTKNDDTLLTMQSRNDRQKQVDPVVEKYFAFITKLSKFPQYRDDLKIERKFPFYICLKNMNIVNKNLSSMSTVISAHLSHVAPTRTIPIKKTDFIVGAMAGTLITSNIVIGCALGYALAFFRAGNKISLPFIQVGTDYEVEQFVNNRQSDTRNRTYKDELDTVSQNGMNMQINSFDSDNDFNLVRSKLPVSVQVNVDGFLKDAVTMGISRFILQYQNYVYRRNVDVRDWMFSRIQQNELEKRNADPKKIQELDKIIDNYQDRIIKISKKIKDYENE